MQIVLVHIHIKPESETAFKEASLKNAQNSMLEPGIARFDVIQQEDDPTRFVLVEVYRNPEAPAEHKKTAHYLRWREDVESMMAEPRRSSKYLNLHPDDEGWDS